MIDSEIDSEIPRTPQAHMPGSPFSMLQANNIPANLLASQALQIAAAEIPAQQQQQQFQLANPNLLSAEKSIRVQFLTTKQSLRTVSGNCEQVRVVGSLPQLNDWGVGCNMEDRNGAWTWDMVLSGNYTPETVIEFLYKYTAYNDRGELIWESRVSRCRLQLDKLLDHVFNSGHVAHTKTKVVFQANGIPPCDESMDLIIAGSLPALGSWDLKTARGLRKASAGGTHHTTVFVSEGTRFNYAYFLVRRMGVLFHGLPGSFVTTMAEEENNAAILWGSGVGLLKASANEQACVQLLDEWEHAAEGTGASYTHVQSTIGNLNAARALGVAAKEPMMPLVVPINPNKPLIANTPEELMELQQKLADRLQCKVCWESDVQMVFLPCGHTCACWTCGQKMAKCALCRALIQNKIRTYI